MNDRVGPRVSSLSPSPDQSFDQSFVRQQDWPKSPEHYRQQVRRNSKQVLTQAADNRTVLPELNPNAHGYIDPNPLQRNSPDRQSVTSQDLIKPQPVHKRMSSISQQA